MKKFVVMAVMMLAGFAAKADDARPVWACSMGFQGRGGGVQLLVGSFKSVAYGEIRCTDLIGGEYIQPVKITIGAEPVALNVGIGVFDFVGGAAQINLMNLQPNDLLGNYVVVQGRAAFALGAGVFTAVHSKFPSLALNISVELLSGLGIQAGVNWMRIEAI